MDINILYINLDHRTDRKEHMERSLQGYNYERVSAIEDKDGYIGCAKSHIKCIEIARARKYQRVIILEDDFMFYKDNNFKNISLPETFDIFLLCNRIKKHVSLNDTFIKVKDCSWTSGHILNQSIYNDLIDLMNPNFPKANNKKENPETYMSLFLNLWSVSPCIFCVVLYLSAGYNLRNASHRIGSFLSSLSCRLYHGKTLQ